MKTKLNFRDQAWNRYPPPPRISQSLELRIVFYPISIMPKIFIEDSGNLKNPKNVKTISNITSSRLVSCCIIPGPATING